MVKFYGFLFDREQGTISRDDEVFHLEHQQAKILNLLIDNRDTVVSREQIAEEVWQGVIVEDNTITKAITRLRKVFNDSAKSSKIIKTIPKKGYQFIAEFERLPELNEVSQESSVAKKANDFVKYGWALTALIVLFGLISNLRDPEPEVSSTVVLQTPKPISFREGVELNAHLHADKNQLLFVGDNDDGYGIYSKTVGDANARLLTKVSSRFVFPKWLHGDNTTFVYSDIDEQGQCQIYKVESLVSVSPEVLTTCLTNHPIEVFVAQYNKRLIWSDSAGSWQYDLSSGNRKSMSVHQENTRFQMPSPDGKRWAVLKHEKEQSYIVVYDIDSKEQVLKYQLPYAISHFRWSSASDGLYHLGEHPANQLYQVSLSGEQLLLASTSLGTMTSISDLQSADTLEFIISSVDLDIHKLANGRETKLVNSPFADYNPAVSNRTKRLAFASKRTGSAQVWLQLEDGTLEQVTQFERASYIFEIAWSPNDALLLVKRNESIHILDLETLEERVLPINAKNKVAWQWISDKRIAYVDEVSNTLFSVDIRGQNASVLKTHLGRAYLVDGQWYVSDIKGVQVYKFDRDFAKNTLLTSQLNNRHWIVSQGQVLAVNLVNNKPDSLVQLSMERGEQRILSGSFNPLSLKATSQGDIVFQRLNRNEANIYQLHLK